MACGVLVFIIGPGVAGAHTVLLSRGVVRLEPERVVVNVAVDAEDFLHLYDVASDRRGDIALAALSRAAERHGAALASALVLRSGSGRPLAVSDARRTDEWTAPVSENGGSGRLEAARVDLSVVRGWRAHYTLTYARSAGMDVLFAHYRPTGRAARAPARLALRVESAHDACRPSVELTSGGNLEALGGAPAAWTVASAFHHVGATVERRGSDLTVEIILPIGVLESWVPCPRQDPDVLTSVECAACGPAVEDLLRGAVAVRSDTGAVLPVVTAVRFEPLRQDSAEEALSVWTSRLRAHLTCTVPPAAQTVELRWRLYNGLVVAMPLTVHRSDGTQRVLATTLSPPVVWDWGG